MTDIAEDLLTEAAQKAARQAKQAAWLAMLALAVALAVLAIDNGIKRAILEEARKARNLLAEAHELTTMLLIPKEAAGGAQAAGEDGTAGSGGDDGPDVLVDAPGASAAAGNHAAPRRRPAGSRPARKTARPGRDG